MPRLTDAQKLENKQLRSQRDAQYKLRRREYEAAKAATEQAIAELPEQAAADAAQLAWSAKLDERNLATDAIQRRIEALYAELQETKERFEAELEPLSGARKATSNARFDAVRRLEAATDAQFPDLQGCWGPAQWKPELRPQG